MEKIYIYKSNFNNYEIVNQKLIWKKKKKKKIEKNKKKYKKKGKEE